MLTIANLLGKSNAEKMILFHVSLIKNSQWRLQLEKPNKYSAQSAKQTLDSFLWCWYLNAEQILALTILLSREKHENMKSLLCFTENALNYISPTVSPQGTHGLNWELGLLDEMQEMLRSEMEAENCYHWLLSVASGQCTMGHQVPS